MYQGSCLCGGVQYEYHGEISEVAICHCSQCRRAQGTPFVTNAPVPSAQFVITRGENLLKSYFSHPLKRRVFCSECGSPIFSQRTDHPEILRLRVGSLSGDVAARPGYHIYHDSRANWFTLTDDLPRYAENKA